MRRLVHTEARERDALRLVHPAQTDESEATMNVACEQCGKAIDFKASDYKIVGIKHVGRSWPNAYVHRGDCLNEWQAQQNGTQHADRPAQAG